jgi:hypothetical protein
VRGGSRAARKERLGHRDIKTTMIYAHLSSAHPPSEIAKTERPASAAATGEALRTRSTQRAAPEVQSGELVEGTA